MPYPDIDKNLVTEAEMLRAKYQMQLQRLEEKKKELAEQQAEVENLMKALVGPAEHLAEQLHGAMCHYSHDDSCGWFYDKDFTGRTRSRWLRRAQRLLNKFPQVSADTLGDIIHSIYAAEDYV